MALEKVTKHNHILHPPFYPVFDYWYNVLVDHLNTYLDDTSNITPVVRTNNPILAANTINQNIDVLDGAIGADNTAVARTNNPTVVNTSLNAKVQALDNAIGITQTVSVRTVGPILATNAITPNIAALDTAIGTDAQLTAVARTAGPIATSQSVNQNIDDLDAAIGANISPLTRTTGQLVAANTVNDNIDLIDDVIGSDAQMPTSSLNVTRSQTIYQNLRALDTYKTVRTVKYRVGNVGVASCDFNFSSAANANEQSIDLGAILPAKCRLLDVMVYTDAAFTNLGALTTDVGLTTGTDGLIVAADNTAIDAIMATSDAGAFVATPNKAAQNIWLNVKPTNNWDSANPVGRMSVYVTFIDVTNV